MVYKKFKYALLFSLSVLLLISCQNHIEGEHALEGTALGTTYHIKYYGELSQEKCKSGVRFNLRSYQ